MIRFEPECLVVTRQSAHLIIQFRQCDAVIIMSLCTLVAEHHCLFIARNSLSVTTKTRERRGKIDVGHGVVWSQRMRALKGGQSLGRSIADEQHGTACDLGIKMVRVHRQRTIIDCQRVHGPSGLGERVTKIVKREGAVGLQRQGSFITRDGFRRAFERLERDAPVGKDVGQICSDG